MKVCKNCNIEKPLDNFYTAGTRNGKAIYRGKCKECELKEKRKPEGYLRADWIVDNPKENIVYQKCKIMAYSAKSRVTSPSKEAKSAYQNLKTPFGFSSAREMIIFLYENFYDDIEVLLKQEKTPSVDRIDTSVGYTPGNIRVIDFTENTLRGVENTKSPVKVTYLDGTVKNFDSVISCAKEFKTDESHVRGWLAGKWKPKNKCVFEYLRG
jgi:hypothetical protein